MLKFFKYKWAVDGETTAVPNAVDPSGFVSYRQGYGADYSRVYGTDPLAKAPERVKLNAVLQDITAELQSVQVHGFPDYITSALNEGSPYAYDIGAIVRWTDNKNYINTVALNTDDPATAGWILYNDPSTAINDAPSKVTPIGADKIGIWDSVTGLLNSVSFTNLWAQLAGLFAPIDSPALTGTPTAPTAPAGTNNTQVATTAFANSLLAEVVVSGAAVTSIDFTGLDILTHKSYILEIDSVNPSIASTYLFINADTTQANYGYNRYAASGTSASVSNGALAYLGNTNAGYNASGLTRVSFAGGETQYTSDWMAGASTSAGILNYKFTTQYTPMIANVTALSVVSSVAGGLGIGTKVRLYRGDV